ncbi:DMT family transporter [Tissierella sp. MB52-C2]|uniref:DMT family transporter n=1 Tax=Tissierella sp. MB52-C2 TaxID=3070999 RepID=UPI00280C08CE|nr:DMT family transporter [Tissierella sp. MB52-C2]WMM24980.1 DMT family transporter [Tissierella sp. MB52-C2]
MYRFYAIFIGVLITIMVTFNGTLDSYLGNYLSILVIHIVGLTAILGILIFKKIKPVFKKEVPLYLYSGGAIGVLLVLANNISFSALGASLTLALGVFGQLILSSAIDHYGLMGMDTYKFHKKKIVGFGIILVGIIIMTIY